MSSREPANVRRGVHQDAETLADGSLQHHQSVARRWSESGFESGNEVAGRLYHSYPSRPDWSDSEDDDLDQSPTRGPSYNPHGEPHSPAPPYSEHDRHLNEGEPLPNSRFNLNPGEGGRPAYITDSSGRRERYIIDGGGERVLWPYPDHVDSSDDDGESEMIHLESGTVIPRAEWDAHHPWYPSSDESLDDTDVEVSQIFRDPLTETRNATAHRSHLTERGSIQESPRDQSRNSAESRHSRVENHATWRTVPR